MELYPCKDGNTPASVLLMHSGVQGQHCGVHEDCAAGGVYSSHDDASGFSEDPTVSRSRSTSEDAAGCRAMKMKGHAQHQGSSVCAERQSDAVENTCHADEEGSEVVEDDNDSAMIESDECDDGDDGDMEEEDDEEEEDEMEEEEEQDDPEQQHVYMPDFDEFKLEATTRSSKEHEKRVCRIIETCFAGHGLIPFERLYRASQPLKDVTRDFLLQRDHILLAEPIASKVKIFLSCHVEMTSVTCEC